MSIIQSRLIDYWTPRKVCVDPYRASIERPHQRMPQLPIRNRLLSALPANGAASLLPHLVIAAVAAGQVFARMAKAIETPGVQPG